MPVYKIFKKFKRGLFLVNEGMGECDPKLRGVFESKSLIFDLYSKSGLKSALSRGLI